jgi:hypothetical protein
MRSKFMVILPYSVERVLKRNSLALSAVLNFEKIRPHLSADDMASLLAAQDIPSLNVIKDSYRSGFADSWKSTTSGGSTTELNSVVIPLSQTPSIIKSVTEQLQTTAANVDATIVDPPYRVVDISRDAYAVIAYPGFAENISSDENAIVLLREVLRILYVYHSISAVSGMDVFKTYVKLLEKQTTTLVNV